ncbi:hypothetical protein E4T66_17840 [Sinimarinibacterium sp. CAU 1509]|uniref:hypothetical protein n=1 Tax=Sinimarinibacterium sp. CAU 1509 TaxID=2562283 RepID=UPI0010AD4B59|nr:hypothetical protein [Sinimarinibacterium sp. CAU 1509]TJY57269.1 hypothetical protein E4T66_17840 [Sinimarinibacterium sp. CAU 1509]
MTAEAHAYRHIPHPMWPGAHEAVRRFRNDSGATVVLSTDALELLLEESDLDDSIHAAHIFPLDAANAYYGFGVSQAVVGWSIAQSRTGQMKRIDGTYCASKAVDAIAMSVDERARFNLEPTLCEVHRLHVVDRVADSPACNLVPIDLVLQDPGESVNRLITRTLQANQSAANALGGERFDGFCRHLFKLWLYLSAEPEVHRTEPAPPPAGFVASTVLSPFTTLKVGPTQLERLLTPRALHDDAIAVWRRGRFSVSGGDAADQVSLRWLHPALERRDPSQPF